MAMYGATSSQARTNPSRVIGWPSREMRSRTSSRCGLVKRPVFMPKAVSSESIMRDVEVLPLVPVMWIDG